MAQQSSIPNSPTKHEMTDHVRDYARFTKLFTWGAIVAALTAFIVILIIY